MKKKGKVTEKDIEDALKEIEDEKDDFVFFGYCKTNGLMSYATGSYLCSDSECCWCSSLIKGMKDYYENGKNEK